jgi:hypothetical protein
MEQYVYDRADFEVVNSSSEICRHPRTAVGYAWMHDETAESENASMCRWEAEMEKRAGVEVSDKEYPS